MSLISLLITLSLTFVGSTFCKAIATNKKSLLYSTTILLGIAVLSYSDDITAFAAIDANNLEANPISTQENRQLQEDLRLTPGGNNYSGIEHARRNTEAVKTVDDETIRQNIEAYTNDNLIVSVANGSVRLSGTVRDKDVARHIVEQALAIPGVYEITFNLGLENTAS